jgi:serine/threonine-protein kinase
MYDTNIACGARVRAPIITRLMPEHSWNAGHVLAARYRLERRLGEGGMGSVWKADHLTLRSPVAVKLIDEKIADNKEALNRFMREAQAAAALRSSNVVQILDYGVEGKTPYMVMELLEGESLAERLHRVRRLSAAETVRVLHQVARAMGRAHDLGIVHRDLKPENIFIVSEHDVEIVKVLDFGVAKMQHASFGYASGMGTRSGSLLGTPFYMSPEQAEGDRPVDWRSDLWSMAVIAYECLTGQRPFESPGLGNLLLQICSKPVPVPSRIAPVPPGFDAWFARALERDPDRRFQSAKELVDALRREIAPDAAADGAMLAPRDDSSGQFRRTDLKTPVRYPTPVTLTPSQFTSSLGLRRTRDRRKWLMAAGTGALLLIAILSVWATRSEHTTAETAVELVTAPVVAPPPRPALAPPDDALALEPVSADAGAELSNGSNANPRAAPPTTEPTGAAQRASRPTRKQRRSSSRKVDLGI